MQPKRKVTTGRIITYILTGITNCDKYSITKLHIIIFLKKEDLNSSVRIKLDTSWGETASPIIPAKFGFGDSNA